MKRQRLQGRHVARRDHDRLSVGKPINTLHGRFRRHFAFWAICALVRRACTRLASETPRRGEPLERLDGVLRERPRAAA